jgi:serine/threonine protein kinase
MRDDLLQEWQIMHSVVSANVIRYYGVEIYKSKCFLFMEYCPEGTLSTYIAKNGAIRTEQVREISSQIVLGLRALHDLNIVHRDLKPANIFFDKNFVPKLGDLGSSRIIGDSPLENMVGTYVYMAPEVLREKAQDVSADIWSLGCVVYEMASGRPPYDELNFHSSSQIIYKVGSGEVPRPCAVLGFCEECTYFLDRCFQRDKKDRPSIQQLQKDPFIAPFLTRSGSVSA